MSIGGVVDLPHIDARDILREAELWYLPSRSALERILTTLESVRTAAETADIEDHERAVETRELVLQRSRLLLDSAART